MDVVSLIEKLKEYVQSSPVEKRRKDDLPEMAAASKSAREILAQALARKDTILPDYDHPGSEHAA